VVVASKAGADASVLIVIVNYRTGRLVVDCLRSLEAEVRDCLGARVAVVDNASPDDSASVIASAIERESWDGWVELMRSPVNGGFSYGNNFAVRPALTSSSPPDFIWILNPDTQARPGALRALIDFLRANPRVGIAGSSLCFEDDRNWPHAFRFPSIWSEVSSGFRLGPVARLLRKHTVTMTMPQDRPMRVDWLPGASMMVRREVFEQIGLMDEGYFLYFEETDFLLQTAKADWECWYVPASRVMHIAGQSTGVTGEHALKRRPQYWFESRRRYWVKNHGRAYAALTDVAWAVAYATQCLRRVLLRQPLTEPPHFMRDVLRNSALFHGGVPTHRPGRAPR
jgi:N-acetylglucosaminyl-diphospho-decaprenol L-rhamnosyltransferase